MKFSFKLFILILLSFTTKAQIKTKSSSKNINELYLEAKSVFTKFEKLHGHFIKTKNARMHYLTLGNPKNIPLIWSHGSLSNAYELYDVADKLTKAGYYVIAIDYYGHGLTSIPNKEVSLYHIADDIEFLMNKLAIKKAVIGGFSRGGYISSAFYDTYPNRVLGLILADGGSVSSSTHYHQLGEAAVKEQFKSLDIKTHLPWDSTYNSEFDAYKNLFDSTENGNQFKNLILIKKNKSGRYGVYEGLSDLFYMSNSQEFLDLIFRPTKTPLFAKSMFVMEPKIILRSLDVPILILDPISSNDPFPFEKENKALQKQHPSLVKYVVYPNVEHNILYAEPKKFTKDLIYFLNDIKLYNQIK